MNRTKSPVLPGGTGKEVSETITPNGKNHCTQHRVEFDKLYNIVLDEIRSIAQNTIDTEDVVRNLADAYENERKEQNDLLEQNITKAKNRIMTLERMTSKLYEDLLAEKITENIFNSMLDRTKKETEELQKEIEDLEKRLSKNTDDEGDARKWIDLIKDYADITQLDAESLNRLIKKIVVHEEITEDGNRNISLEIHYNFRPMDESKTHNISDYAEAHANAEAM